MKESRERWDEKSRWRGWQREKERGKERRVLSVRNVARAGACPVVTCCLSLA